MIQTFRDGTLERRATILTHRRIESTTALHRKLFRPRFTHGTDLPASGSTATVSEFGQIA
jgi:hypothetical protein